MRDTENIFDTSTTLMEIEEPPEDGPESARNDGPPPSVDREPDYFTPNPAPAHVSARRRGLAVLGLVGGGIFTAILISAATGSGNDRAGSMLSSRVHGDAPAPGKTATIVGPEPAARPHPRPSTIARRAPGEDRHGALTSGRGGRGDNASSSRASGGGARTHRKRHHSRKPPAATAAAPPEPSYSPEPETAYVPTEAAPPPPPTTPPPSPAPSPSRAAQQEFGIEP